MLRRENARKGGILSRRGVNKDNNMGGRPCVHQRTPLLGRQFLGRQKGNTNFSECTAEVQSASSTEIALPT